MKNKRSNNWFQYTVSWCPNCDQGWVTIVKEIKSKRLFFECEIEWDHPEDIKKDNKGTHDKYGKIGLPTKKDIKKSGWQKL